MDWEEDGVKRGMMLNLMPIPHVLEMNEIIPTRKTDNSGMHALTSGPDVRDIQAKSNNFRHTPKQTAVGCSTKHNVGMSRRTHPKHDTAPVSLRNRHTITLCLVSDHKSRGR